MGSAGENPTEDNQQPYGMSGDLQGIAGKEIIALPGLDVDRDVSYMATSKNEEPPKNICIAGRDEDEY